MKSGHEEIREMLPGYLGGSLEEEINNEIEVHLRECPACRDEIAFLTELVSTEVPDPGDLFWKSLPRKVRLAVAEKKRRHFTVKTLLRWLPAPVGVTVLLLLVLSYTYTNRKEMPEQDLFPGDPLTASVADYSDISEKDIPAVTEQLAGDDLSLPQESVAGYSYHREFASLSAEEMESLYEALKTAERTGG